MHCHLNPAHACFGGEMGADWRTYFDGGTGSAMAEEQTGPDPAANYDHQKWSHEMMRRDGERAHDYAREQGKEAADATREAGQVALRTLVLVNGGAAVSVLAFIGGLTGQGRIQAAQLNDVAGILLWFAS